MPDAQARLGASAVPLLQIRVDTVGRQRRLRVRGELDLHTSTELSQVLSAQLAAGHRHVCVDLSGLTFCDASGLNTLLAAHRAHQAVAGTLTIAEGYSRQFARLLCITELDRVLLVVPKPSAPESSSSPG